MLYEGHRPSFYQFARDRHATLLWEAERERLCPPRSYFAEQFRTLYKEAQWHRFWARLTGRCYQLLSLRAIQMQHRLRAFWQHGVQAVPIAAICGSEGRCGDFDADFRPLNTHEKDRWVNIALARSQGETLPPVVLVQFQHRYFVRDGHHRISVAKRQGQLEIEAEVVLWH